MKVKRALISVADKSGLENFAKGLDSLGVDIISTGGTARFLRSLGLRVKDVSSYTGFPEIMDGRVKTLHPKIHGALLGLRGNAKHLKEAGRHSIEFIDMVVVNLYPFSEVISKKRSTFEEAIENIDIGGPSMLRSASKNFKDVAVVSSPLRYEAILRELGENDCSLCEDTLHSLAVETFEKTAEYDSIITAYLRGRKESAAAPSVFPENPRLSFRKIRDLRYGENPHQKAAFFADKNSAIKPSLVFAKKLHGKDLSFNNIIDLDAALETVSEFSEPACVIIKHATPCGIAIGADIKRAFMDAHDCDRMSAFGGIVGLNGPVDIETARAVRGAGFLECIVASRYSGKALEILTKKKNFRIMEADFRKKVDSGPKDFDIKKIRGGVLFQERDRADIAKKDLKCVTRRRPSPKELNSLYFAWKAVKHVKSNAIVLASGRKTVGMGAGQMSRVDSVVIAINKAGDKARGSVLASDAFFPKPDSIEAAANAGVKAVIQPGGSVADEEVIKAADRLGLSMVFTGMRHFKH